MLTPREEAVARLVAGGMTNHEIGRRLGIAPRTVEWNLTRIYRKLGVRSRAHLAGRIAATPWVQRASK